MKINFVLPGFFGGKIIGGFRVHYEYANRLARLGHEVIVSHMLTVDTSDRLNNKKLRYYIKHGVAEYIPWFTFDSKVKVTLLPNNRFAEPCDVLILTAWQTAEVFGDRHDVAWLTIQIAYDYEFWMSADRSLKRRMAAAFKKPDCVISTSNAVSKMLIDCEKKIDVSINCGFDADVFRLSNPIENRGVTIGILLRDDPIKRVLDGIAALEIAKNESYINVLAAGRYSGNLPDWVQRVDTTRDQDLSRFYNSLSIFILPSEYEGWGLPAIEAMACGSTVISTRNGGVEDFLEDGHNSLLCASGDIENIALAITKLIRNDSLRMSLANNGLETVKNYSWIQSIGSLDNFISGKYLELFE